MAPLHRRFFHLTWLNILTNVTVPFAGLVDTAMLGHLADIRFLAGVALGTLIFDYVYWSVGFLRMGTTGLAAQALGRAEPPAERRNDAASRELDAILLRSAVVALALAALLLLLRQPLEDLSFAFLGGEPEVEAAGRDYYRARIWGAPAVLLNLVFLGWFLGREESRLALAMTAVASVGNIVLDYLFILRWGMAAHGAGLATAISQYLMLVAAVAFYLPRASGGWRWHEIFDRAKLVGLLRLQADLLIRTLCLVTTFAVFVNASALLGTVALAANTLLLRLLNFAAFFIDGAAFATETLAGVFHGGGKAHETRPLLRLALLAGLAFGATFALAAALWPEMILGLLTSHTDVITFAVRYRGWMIAALLFGSVAYILDGFFLGLTAGPTLRDAMLISTLLFFAPVAAASWWIREPHVPWLAMTIFMLARGLTLGRAAARLPDLTLRAS